MANPEKSFPERSAYVVRNAGIVLGVIAGVGGALGLAALSLFVAGGAHVVGRRIEKIS